jgi:hypothetical protein
MYQYFNSHNLNILGLLFNFIGSIIILKFGVPNEIKKYGESYLLLEQEDNQEKKKYLIYSRFQTLGIIMLILGFLIQLIATVFFN